MRYIDGKFIEIPVVKIASIENAERAYIIVDGELIDKCSMRELVKEYTMENVYAIDLKEVTRLGNCRIHVVRKPTKEIVKARFDTAGGTWTFTHSKRVIKVGTEVFYKCYTPLEPKKIPTLKDIRREVLGDRYEMTYRYMTPLGAFETGVIEEKQGMDELEYYYDGMKFVHKKVSKRLTIGDLSLYFAIRNVGQLEKVMYFRLRDKKTGEITEFDA